MKTFTKKLSLIALCTLFSTMQISLASVDTGLGVGNGGAVINHTTGGYAGLNRGTNSATLNFNGDSHVYWNTLNVNSGETLNFNAVPGANSVTVLNTVSQDMTRIYGNINANQGISNLIISNPNGLLFDGANITTAGDVMLTTQGVSSTYTGRTLFFTGDSNEVADGVAVTIQDSNFSVGGTFSIIAPTIRAAESVISADSFKLVTADGENFLVSPTTSNNVGHKAVRLDSVEVNGNIYITTGKDLVNIVNGGHITGDLEINSKGNVAVNYTNNDKTLYVDGNVTVNNNGTLSYLRNSEVGGNVNMSNAGGFLEVKNIDVNGDVNLTTTADANAKSKHFIHVVGDNNIDGNLNVDSIHNVHLGGYEDKGGNGNISDFEIVPSTLNVGGKINALAREGSVGVVADIKADQVSLESGTLNIISDGQANIIANEYNFKANQYIGSIADEQDFINSMEQYKLINPTGYLNIEGGEIKSLETNANGYAFVRANNDMLVTGVNATNVKLASAKDIQITGSNVHADQIIVDGETINLTVDAPSNSRDYVLRYTDIRDNARIVIDKDVEITYDLANGDNGLNKGTQIIGTNTYLVAPGQPTPPGPTPDPPGPTPDPPSPTPDPPSPTPDPTPDPPDNDNVKLMNFVPIKDPDSAPIATPIAFAADLDDEIDTGVRKNVDGSVTVVRPYTSEEE